MTSGGRYWNCGYKSSIASVFHKRSVFYPESQFLSQEDSTYIMLSYSTLQLSLKIYSEPQYLSLDVFTAESQYLSQVASNNILSTSICH